MEGGKEGRRGMKRWGEERRKGCGDGGRGGGREMEGGGEWKRGMERWREGRRGGERERWREGRRVGQWGVGREGGKGKGRERRERVGGRDGETEGGMEMEGVGGAYALAPPPSQAPPPHPHPPQHPSPTRPIACCWPPTLSQWEGSPAPRPTEPSQSTPTVRPRPLLTPPTSGHKPRPFLTPPLSPIGAMEPEVGAGAYAEADVTGGSAYALAGPAPIHGPAPSPALPAFPRGLLRFREKLGEGQFGEVRNAHSPSHAPSGRDHAPMGKPRPHGKATPPLGRGHAPVGKPRPPLG